MAALARSTLQSALMLLPTAAIAALGLGYFALTVTRPVADLPALAPLAARLAVPDAPMVEPRILPDWVALFGQPAAPEPPAEPEPQPLAPAPLDPLFDPTLYVLRGLLVDADGGYALLETQDGLAVYHAGDRLPDGERVIAITDLGVEIEAYGETWLITFGEPTDDPAPSPDDQDFTGSDEDFPPVDDPDTAPWPLETPQPPSRRDPRASSGGQRPFGMPILPQTGTNRPGTNDH